MHDPIGELRHLTRTVRRLPIEARALLTVITASRMGPESPARLVAMHRALDRYGPMAASVAIAAQRHGPRTGLIDELGSLTFTEMDDRSNALANSLRGRGVAPGRGVGILSRNHRGLLDASFGVLKAGGRAVYLNTDFSAPQAAQVCSREEVDILIYDQEFSGVVAGVAAPGGRFVAWTDGADGDSGDDPTLETLIQAGNPEPPPPPSHPGDAVILTSGTTGVPKGANRSAPRSVTAAAAILSRIPFRGREATYVASPIYHSWGMGVSVLNVSLGSTVVMRRRFDPEAALTAVAEHRCSAISLVPAMLNRLLSLGADRIGSIDLTALRIIASSGSQLEAALATRAMDTFGEKLYNLYGSTEVAWATIATPADLRAAPGCAGKPPLGTRVEILDEHGLRRPFGATGRIFVSSGMEFAGYTGGGTKEVVDGLMSTGDVGHFDRAGRLFVDGRDDEMIVSGGENVFPREVEELVSTHEAVLEAAAIGVADEEFGQRLLLFVVVRPGYTVDATEIKEQIRANLARYKVPRQVVFLDHLPRNATGKVLKRDLPAMVVPD
jgi:fatty-acyl-CoA synthase